MGNWKRINYVDGTDGRIVAATTNPVFVPNSGDKMLVVDILYRMLDITYNFSDDVIYIVVKALN